MNDKHRRFAAEYVIDRNATQAAIRAGYSPRTARQQGEQLLSKPDIAAFVSEKQQKAMDACDLSAAETMWTIARPLRGDVRKLFTPEGTLKPITELSDEEASMIGGFEVIKKNAEAGDGHMDIVHKVKLIDRARYVEMAAKHFALLTEKIELSGKVDVIEVLRRRFNRK